MSSHSTQAAPLVYHIHSQLLQCCLPIDLVLIVQMSPLITKLISVYIKCLSDSVISSFLPTSTEMRWES